LSREEFQGVISTCRVRTLPGCCCCCCCCCCCGCGLCKNLDPNPISFFSFFFLLQDLADHIIFFTRCLDLPDPPHSLHTLPPRCRSPATPAPRHDTTRVISSSIPPYISDCPPRYEPGLCASLVYRPSVSQVIVKMTKAQPHRGDERFDGL